MELEEWEKFYSDILEKDVDHFIKEHEDEIVHPNPLKTKEQQIAAYREELLKQTRPEATAKQLEAALVLIRDHMPHTVSKEIWDQIFSGLSQCEKNLLDFLESNKDKPAEENKIHPTPVYQMLGFTEDTLTHFYTFGQSFFNKKAYDDSRKVMAFLVNIAPHVPEFWIAMAMCDKEMKHYQMAIETYKLAEVSFPDRPDLYLFCAENCLLLNDNTEAKMQLEKAKHLLDHNKEMQTKWKPIFDYLISRVKK